MRLIATEEAWSIPEVAEALRSKGRARTVRRSIALTPFGEDFCARTLT